MKFRRFFLLMYTIAATQMLMTQIVFGMGSDSSSSEATKPVLNVDFEAGKKAIDQNDWAGAISSFNKVIALDSKNADAFNYLGYANRQLGHYEKAFDYYHSALRLKPNHKGANEYIGEAYLKQGDLASAEKHLAKLDDICTFGCAEYSLLKRAVAEYKQKNG
ncbi:MAG: tetratricopeptide repeat protein [Sneathiella sp.]|nr:tetratricopeptide repeat protein [Sneathiella sp.]